MTVEDTLEHCLGELGLGIRDITQVINTHLHFDHCEHNYLFANTGIPVTVQRAHYEAALADPTLPNEYFEIEGIDYQFVDGEIKLFPGIRSIMSPGHAPHRTSLMLDLPRTGRVLLCIDAIFIEDNIAHDAWDSMADPQAARLSGHKLRRIAEEEGAMIVYGHDPAQWEQLRHAPEYYD